MATIESEDSDVAMPKYVIVETVELTCLGCVFDGAKECTKPSILELCEQYGEVGERHFIYVEEKKHGI